MGKKKGKKGGQGQPSGSGDQGQSTQQQPQQQQQQTREQQPRQPREQQPQQPREQQPQQPKEQQPRQPQPLQPTQQQPRQQQPQQPRQQQPQQPRQQQPQQPRQQQPQQPRQQQPQQPRQQQPQQPRQQEPQQPRQQQPRQQQPQQPRQQQPRQPRQQQPQELRQQQPQQPPQQPRAWQGQQQQAGPWRQGPQQTQQQQPTVWQRREQAPQQPQQEQVRAWQGQERSDAPQQQQRQPQVQLPVSPPPADQKAGGKGKRQQKPAAEGRPQVPKDVEALSQGMQQVSIQPTGAGEGSLIQQCKAVPGKKGRPIHLEVNHVKLDLGKVKTAYHYDVNIVPDTPKRFLRTVMELFRYRHFPNRYPAFDGRKNLYTSRPLSNNLNDLIGDDNIVVQDEEGRGKTYKVEIKFAAEVDLQPLREIMRTTSSLQQALQCVDIVLRTAPAMTCVPVGRSFFVKPERIIDLGEGMEMYNGFYQSVIRGWKPLLNIDVAHKAFPKNEPVINMLPELFSTRHREVRVEDLARGLDRNQEEILNKYVRTLRITYEIPNNPASKRGYRVNGIDEPPARKRFTHEGRQMTILDYFRTVKRYTLRYPNLPTLWVGPQQRQDKILLPLELCTINEGQGVNRKMTENQTSTMIRYAATSASVRKDKIMTGLRRADYNSSPYVREFGFSVANQFERLTGRVLEPPSLTYYGNREVRPGRGVWRNEKFLQGVTINKWTIASVTRYPPKRDDLGRMVTTLRQCAQTCGMNITAPPDEPFQNIGGRQTLRDIEAFFRSIKSKGYEVIFVVVPDSGRQYSDVKRAAEITVGCLTQCVKNKTLYKMNNQTGINLLLKVNSKLSGTNHQISRNFLPAVMMKPCMIMGADVTHPSPDSRGIPSVAAVTASHCPRAFQYNICWRLQPPTVEIIEDLKNITREHLLFFFRKNNKAKPEHIIFFRDGVSEGQFEQVLNIEFRAIRAACKELQATGYEPKITFLVVQKRHHTRLFPMNPRDSEDKNGNVPAGTCVDSEITNPMMQDFYLVSHASIQGVAKPTKYCVLHDDNDMDNDTIEELAYYLCHMFTRCNRSVSYPAPTYYAHLAAARAKVYIENENLNMDRLQQECQRFEILQEIRQGLPMFFV